MKTMTCRQLGGACDHPFRASTFEEISTLSRQHGMEMFQKGDAAHIQAMEQMRSVMKSPEEMNAWMANKRMEFDALPES